MKPGHAILCILGVTLILLSFIQVLLPSVRETTTEKFLWLFLLGVGLNGTGINLHMKKKRP